jgi:hypothetical protein
MLFERRLREGIADGSITVMFRRWRRRQVVAGGTYRTGTGRIGVDTVEIIEPAAITARDARRAGYGSAAEARADLRGPAEAPVYRIGFHRLDEADPRDTLADCDRLDAAAVAAIDARLDRLDRAAEDGPWTAAALAAVAERPDTAAAILAAALGQETLGFKRRVRALKALGLTRSQPVGYRLSPRGIAYRAASTRPAAPGG